MHSITLKKIFKKYDIKACKLLKIDCEGAEYEILYNTDKNILKRCEYLRGEFHEDVRIREAGYSADTLKKYCDEIIGKVDAVVYVDEY
ncbi:MAG: FkbM family methyltransferase [Puniceicoccales bacterium]|nr:FkbM family methyltransferase [Puniceicoccales bacterium]